MPTSFECISLKKNTSPGALLHCLVVFIVGLYSVPVALGQTVTVEGLVLDAQSQDPLPFVSVYLTRSQKGLLADLNGKFYLANVDSGDTLLLTYPGYDPQRLSAESIGNQPIIIRLQATSELQEAVVINPDYNPALRLLRLARQNKALNNPLNRPAFTCKSYNKVKVMPALGAEYSSKLDSFFQEIDLFITENVIQHYHKAGFVPKTVMEATRTSGLQTVPLPFTPEDLQTFSLYDEWLDVLGINVMSPLADAAPVNFDFELDEVRVMGQDTLFTIIFKCNAATLPGFSGVLRLHSARYAVLSLDAKITNNDPASSFQHIDIKQLYNRPDSITWFPEQMSALVDMAPDRWEPTRRFWVDARSYYTQIDLQPALAAKEMQGASLVVSPTALKADDSLWAQFRPTPLTPRELLTYTKVDSIGQAIKLEQKLFLLQKIQKGLIPIKFLDLDILRFYSYNPVERHRIGLGLWTNERLSERFRLGGWFGYATGDKRWKWGLQAEVLPFRTPFWRLQVSYREDLIESGGWRPDWPASQLLQAVNTQILDVRWFYLRKMDYVREASLAIFLPGPRSISQKLGFHYQELTPAFGYRFDSLAKFVLPELSYTVRYAPGEPLTQVGYRLQKGSTYKPVLSATVAGTQADILGSTQTYGRVHLSIDQTVNLKRLGYLRYVAQGGLISGVVPYSRLYVYRALGHENFLAEATSFNAMNLNAFAADLYATLHLRWQVPNTRFPSKRYSPDPTLVGAAAWGTLENGRPETSEFQILAPEKGYYEVGLELSNLLPDFIVERVSTLSLLGLGVYARLGPYADPNFQNNVFIKLIISIL